MATASLDQYAAGVTITDTPIAYTPGLGSSMNFTVTYRQRQTDQPSTIPWSNLGRQWSSNWISFIADGPTNDNGQAKHYAPAGDVYTYGNYVPIAAQGLGAVTIVGGDFMNTQGWTHSSLHYMQGPERYEIWQPDGTKEVYAEAVGTSPNRRFFLSTITDPQGNVTQLTYDPRAAADGKALLQSVTDPTGDQLTFSYGNSLLITKVTRSKDGLSAKFHYTDGQLTGITDTLGITSSFHYSSGTAFVDSMTTPYGTSNFSSTDGSGYLEADMTNPLSQTERAEFRQSLDSSVFPATESSTPSATGLTIDNTNLNKSNSFYWTRRAMADAAAASASPGTAAFYALAQVSHWADTSLGPIPVPLSTKMPLEGRVWYNYQGQSNIDYFDLEAADTTVSPSVTARLLDGGATQATFASYNSLGAATHSVDPLGRTTNYAYATNGIDLLTVKQANSATTGGYDLLSAMTYNSQHEPLSVTDASGQTTNMTYFSNGQLHTRTNAKSETTTLAYNSAKYVSSVTGPVSGATMGYTYDSAGRVHTVTDSEGYVVTTAYDDLDRPVTVTYPDSTTDQTVYKALDVWKTIDRQGRTTVNQYDAIRELLQTTDPLGRSTKYSWCTCGGLSTLTDANGNVTTWGLDLQGRVTSKTYADSTAITYAYETNTGRLHTMTDARGSVATYSYNIDNTLSGTSYSPGSGVAATPNVSFTYDTVYNRVKTMADGTGTTTYAYNAINASVGAGRLASVSVPIGTGTATVTYDTYDELGRVITRKIDGSNPVTTTYDSLGRVTNVQNALAPTSPGFQYAYVNTTNRLSSVTYPSGTGLVTNYSYFDNTGDQRLQTIQNLKSGSNLSKFDYTYNAVGTIATWTQQADSGTAVVNTLGYDAADQLTSAVQSGGGTDTNSYRYDPAGNRLSEATGTGTTTGQFNNLNQLKRLSASPVSQTIAGNTTGTITSATVNAIPATISGSTNFSANVPLPPGSTNVVSVVAQPSSTTGTLTTQRFQVVTSGTAPSELTYDANGNTTTDENGYTYTWDALNRLTKITYASGATSNFAYDGLSRRISIIEKNNIGAITQTKLHLWAGKEIVEERDNDNTVIKRFFVQGERQAGTNYYYTRDHIDSVREMTDSVGDLISRISYDLYGRRITITGTILPAKQYTGMFIHEISGFEMSVFRLYNTQIDRWLNRDPIGEPGGVNLFEYAANDPVDRLDPLGLCSCGLVVKPEYVTDNRNSKSISGNTKFSWFSKFMDDSEHKPTCCEVHQFISSNRVPLHDGFPKDLKAGDTVEDRTDSTHHFQRYGYRSGPYKINPVPPVPGWDEYPGDHNRGWDTPQGWPKGTVFTFHLEVWDTCNGNKVIHTSKSLTVTF